MIKNITLTDDITVVDFNEQGGDPYFYLSNKYAWIKNTGGSAVGITVTGTETVTVSSGECYRVNTPPNNTITLTGTGSVLIVTGNEAASPFNSAQKGGEGVEILNKISIYRRDPDWAIQESGISIEDELHDVVYYAVTGGNLICVKATDDSNACKYVWSTTSDISSTNTVGLVGSPVTEVTNAIVVVPKSARYIAFSQSKTDTETGVYDYKIDLS